MVHFSESRAAATEADIVGFETELGFTLPSGIRELFLTANGGRPTPSIIGGKMGTDVSQCLALREGRGSVAWTYDLLARKHKTVPPYLLPFAVDSGGNTFLVDCRTDDGPVHLLLHELPSKSLSLRMNLDEFWRSLTDKPT